LKNTKSTADQQRTGIIKKTDHKEYTGWMRVKQTMRDRNRRGNGRGGKSAKPGAMGLKKKKNDAARRNRTRGCANAQRGGKTLEKVTVRWENDRRQVRARWKSIGEKRTSWRED